MSNFIKKLKEIVFGIWDVVSSTVILLLIGFVLSVSLCLLIIILFFLFSVCVPWLCVFCFLWNFYEANKKDD